MKMMAEGCQPLSIDGIDKYRLGVGIALSIYTFLALCLQIIAVVVFYILQRQTKLSVYKIMNSLNFSQMVCMFSLITLMLPCTFSSCSFYTPTVNIILSTFQILGHYSALSHNCLIAIERISVFTLPVVHLFVRQHATLYAVIAWVTGSMFVILTTSTRCFKWYNAGIISFTYQCGSCEIIPGVSLINVLMWITQIMVIIMLLGYIIVIISVRIRRGVQGRHNKFTATDAQLLVQGAIICAFQWLNSFMFFILPGTADFGVEAQVITNFIAVTNVGIQALIMLIFNKTFRNTFVRLVCTMFPEQQQYASKTTSLVRKRPELTRY